ncbi:SGNH/GDSL hydrolase family protein [Butyrivibrio sp. XB500-5]|uniref:SGNH/GDSL hydrolase family protein n=1 Tax=Butyrivibrio sp. XB500-5 TaxID=2364880 RepID=UPI000EA85D1B|nr:SGNH/GDSL hydrolase family protein [Butyrivibrio sp. XB500-5]RKM61590.1 SGNH/GDSL hydrolase family protein [Butyrivibrio sp. XB500-5]
MKKENNSSNFINRLIVTAIVLAIAIGAVVYAFDPFYHFHKPWFGMKAVLNDKEYQCIGTLRNFDYDALIVGSSVMENNNNAWYDEAYNVKSIKAIRSYGATADLCYLLDEAFKDHDIKYVFYNIDPSSLSADAETTYESTGCPMYLYDNNPFNDVQYLFNKDVLFEKIPYQLANALSSDYDEGLSYNWAKWKEFGPHMALGLYYRPREVKDMMEETAYTENLEKNIALLTSEVASHQETQFIFFYPVYSMLWWDGIVRTGERDAYIYNEKEMTKALLQYDNVRVFCFQNDRDIATNLEYYMDSLHFSPDINKLMLDNMVSGEGEMTLDNYEEVLDGVKDFSDKIVKELIVPYEEKDMLTYEITE